MNWTEVEIFTTTEGVDPVCGRLLGLGISGFVVKDSKDFEDFLEDKTGNWDYIDEDLMNLKNCETSVTVYLPENSQGHDLLNSIRDNIQRLAELDTEKQFGRLTVELANVSEEDWANNWKQYFKPLTVGKKLLIKPSWEKCPPDESRIILEIDPASSFGTGQHNTTQLCLELLEGCLKFGDRMLDIGCGSGILSIAAMLLGAKEAVAVDIEENSAKTALENANKNNIAPEKYTALCGNILTDGILAEEVGVNYDVLTANIVADVLIAMNKLFYRFLKAGGVLIVSGIIVERKDEVTDTLKETGFDVISVNEKDGWAAVQLVKN